MQSNSRKRVRQKPNHHHDALVDEMNVETPTTGRATGTGHVRHWGRRWGHVVDRQLF
ncbi:hypothetical protein [Haloarcula sp. CBA1130]|uniref:hypothetical protein n=1 Tax=Haloarcula sp. CBA1130 TaxID=1853685 RepID=UPI001CD9D7EB|nr:hypothetical protein [Haloarcula sp. CBA1130]